MMFKTKGLYKGHRYAYLLYQSNGTFKCSSCGRRYTKVNNVLTCTSCGAEIINSLKEGVSE